MSCKVYVVQDSHPRKAETPPRRATMIRIAALRVLAEVGETGMHGLAIARKIYRDRRPHPAIYPVLHRLEDDGLAVSHREEPLKAGGQSRRVYVLTPAGRAHPAARPPDTTKQGHP